MNSFIYLHCGSLVAPQWCKWKHNAIYTAKLQQRLRENFRFITLPPADSQAALLQWYLGCRAVNWPEQWENNCDSLSKN